MAHRCSVCDRTDDRKVTLIPDQFFSGPYLKDARYLGQELCQECVDSINESLYESEEDDPILPFTNY